MILVRILGGYDWWRYGCDQLAAMARAHSVGLHCCPANPRATTICALSSCSTLPARELDALLGYFREGGPENMRGAGASGWRAWRGHEADGGRRRSQVPKAGFYDPGGSGYHAQPSVMAERVLRPIVPYPLLPLDAARLDVAPIDALARRSQQRVCARVPIFVASLRRPRPRQHSWSRRSPT